MASCRNRLPNIATIWGLNPQGSTNLPYLFRSLRRMSVAPRRNVHAAVGTIMQMSQGIALVEDWQWPLGWWNCQYLVVVIMGCDTSSAIAERVTQDLGVGKMLTDIHGYTENRSNELNVMASLI